MVTVDDVKTLKKQRDKARAELEAANVTIGILNTTIKNLEERVKIAEKQRDESHLRYEGLFHHEKRDYER